MRQLLLLGFAPASQNLTNQNLKAPISRLNIHQTKLWYWLARDVNAHPEIEILENMHHCTLERKNIKG